MLEAGIGWGVIATFVCFLVGVQWVIALPVGLLIGGIYAALARIGYLRAAQEYADSQGGLGPLGLTDRE